MENLVQFSNSGFFVVFSAVSILISLATFGGMLFLILKGIMRVLYRLGKALVGRKIAIISNDNFSDIKELLVDSGLIREKNIVHIHKSNLKKMDICSVFVFDYYNCSDLAEDVIRIKQNNNALIVYAEKKPGRESIDESMVEKINQERNAILVNLRGRLLNDVFLSLITTR